MINKIYAFGTSHTCGGGFEFNTISTSPNPNVYKNIIDSENHFDFSYPSLLHQLSGIPVINKAKQGYGNQRVIRKILDTISSDSFIKETSLLLIELSNFDRNEFWCNPIQDYIIVNGTLDSIKSEDSISVANDYHFESFNTSKLLHKNKKILSDFFKLTMEKEPLIKKLQNEFLLLINLLENNSIKYYLTNGDIPLSPNYLQFSQHEKNIIQYKLYDMYNKKYKLVENWISHVIDFKLTIADESDYTINDNHQGLSVSLHVAKTIYNRILTDYNINKNVEETLDLITDWNVVRNKIIPKLI